jgi:hypothetical protein
VWVADLQKRAQLDEYFQPQPLRLHSPEALSVAGLMRSAPKHGRYAAHAIANRHDELA